MVSEAPLRTKVLAGLGLVCVQTFVGVLYKVSQAANGGFGYSTSSAITMAELIKLLMCCMFHFHDASHRQNDSGIVSSYCESFRSQLSGGAILHIWLLSLLYAINNQVSFFIYTLADPGTIFLFKSATTILTAAMQCAFAGKSFSRMQWQAMILQASGMVIVQYDPCKSRTLYEPVVYGYMAFTLLITALTSARNEYLVKHYSIDLNVQNAVLYTGGFVMNLSAFVLFPNPNSSEATIGFLDGYDNPLAIAVVVANALIGLAITMVYKYADAVVKCIASNMTSVLLLIYSSIFLKVQISLIMWMGVFVVANGVMLYVDASKVSTLPSAAAAAAPAPKAAKAA